PSILLCGACAFANIGSFWNSDRALQAGLVRARGLSPEIFDRGRPRGFMNRNGLAWHPARYVSEQSVEGRQQYGCPFSHSCLKMLKLSFKPANPCIGQLLHCNIFTKTITCLPILLSKPSQKP